MPTVRPVASESFVRSAILSLSRERAVSAVAEISIEASPSETVITIRTLSLAPF